MNVRRTPSGSLTPRAAKPEGPARLPWLPHVLGGVATVILVAAVVYAAVTGRLF